jgi:molecular chaperone GrpE (heat shock protein)
MSERESYAHASQEAEEPSSRPAEGSADSSGDDLTGEEQVLQRSGLLQRLEAVEARFETRPADLEAQERALFDLVTEGLEKERQERAGLARRLETLEAGLHGVLARLETFNGMLEAAPAHVEEAEQCDEAEQKRRNLFETVWQRSPFTLRLNFARELLDPEHPYQSVLREATEMEALRRKGKDLESWMSAYPSLFADAVSRLTPPACENAEAPEELVQEILAQAREVLDRDLEAMGVEWIAPRAGEPIGRDQEIVGEASADGIAPGAIASVRRPGFRWRGKLCLPAQVVRAREEGEGKREEGRGKREEKNSDSPSPAERSEGIGERGPGGEGPPNEVMEIGDPNRKSKIENRKSGEGHPFSSLFPLPSSLALPSSLSVPAWLRTLQRRSVGIDSEDVQQVMNHLLSLAEAGAQNQEGGVDDDRLRDLLSPLLPLLGPGQGARLYALPEAWAQAFLESQNDMHAWMTDALALQVIAPAERDPFEPTAMQATGERRTAHAHERGTVAKTECAGIGREGRILIPAKVIRYDTGGSA